MRKEMGAMATFNIDVSVGIFEGGAGSDVFNFYHRGIYLHVYGNAGDDTFNFFSDMPWDWELYGGRRNYLSGGDGNDSFYGNGHTVAWLLGGGGDDLFTGFVWYGSTGSGALGGTGNDTYYVDPASPYPIVENPGEGNDTVVLLYAAPYTRPANVENVIVLGAPPPPPPGGTTITGDNSNNTLTGTAIAETIYGLGGSDTLTGGGGNDTLDGGTGSDKLYGGSGADLLKGGDGNDTLRGDSGRDEAWGGTGADTFVFANGSFGGATATSCDVIHDFSHAQGDRIKLTSVDAKTSTTINDTFAFIGTAGFHDVAGELRYQQIDGNTYVQGDTDGDGAADFWIKLDGLQTLASSDFYL
jgi:Ca2+-binding RTX toxin-like protein